MMNDATMPPPGIEREMTTDEFNAWYKRLGLPEKELAQRLDVTQPTINRWLSGRRTPPPFLWRALEHLEAELRAPRRPRGGGSDG
jgi:DNA-binding transcriptional regulator YiaG